MKLHLVLLIAAVGFSGMAMAQGTVAPANKAQIATEQVAGKVEITAEQKDGLSNIFKTYYEDAAKDETTPEAAQKLATDRDTKVKALLSDDAKYQLYLNAVKELPGN